MTQFLRFHSFHWHWLYLLCLICVEVKVSLISEIVCYQLHSLYLSFIVFCLRSSQKRYTVIPLLFIKNFIFFRSISQKNIAKSWSHHYFFRIFFFMKGFWLPRTYLIFWGACWFRTCRFMSQNLCNPSSLLTNTYFESFSSKHFLKASIWEVFRGSII